MTVIKAVDDLTATFKTLGLAKTAVTTIDTVSNTTQIANIGSQAAAKVAAAAIEVPASVAIATAASAEMAALTAASYAAIPFVGEGLALAQIGVLNAAIMASGIPKFANGGIVGGSSYTGDKVMAGLNSGEMILNGGQQSTLFGLLNGAGGITNQPQTIVLETKLNGRDIYLSQKNYNAIKSKV